MTNLEISGQEPIEKGATYTATITPINEKYLPINIMIECVDIYGNSAGWSYNNTTGQIEVYNVGSDIRITATAANSQWILHATDDYTFGFSFYYEEGMTWQDWIDSDYNQGRYINENNIRIDEYYIIGYRVEGNDLPIHSQPNDIISSSIDYNRLLVSLEE